MNALFSDLLNSYKSSFISADDVSFANDTNGLPIKPMNGQNENNNKIKSIIEKRKQNPCINSSIQVRTKMRKYF